MYSLLTTPFLFTGKIHLFQFNDFELLLCVMCNKIIWLTLLEYDLHAFKLRSKLVWNILWSAIWKWKTLMLWITALHACQKKYPSSLLGLWKNTTKKCFSLLFLVVHYYFSSDLGIIFCCSGISMEGREEGSLTNITINIIPILSSR